MKLPIPLVALTILSFSPQSWAKPAEATPPPPVTMPTSDSDISTWRQSVDQEVQGDILPFWIKNTVDHERGGFYGQVSNDLVVKKDAIRGSLLTARILWAYSAAYRRYKDPASLKMAKWAYAALNKFWDDQDGGFYWSETADGKPVIAEKQVYGEGFAIYALSEYFMATGDQAALDRAIETFRLLEKHAKDPQYGGYWELCERDWKRDITPRHGGMEISDGKSQNTHLHLLEAFTNLLRAWPNDEIRNSHKALIDVVITKILNPKNHHLILFLKDDFTPLSKTISFGHDIEFSWLLTEAGDVRGDAELNTRLRTIAVDVARATLNEGVAPDGGIYYEADEKGPTKMPTQWWADAEAMVGFYNAYQLSGDTHFREASFRVWNFIEKNLVDHKYGEWFWAAKGGVPSRAPKVSMWKCPYHNGRSCMEMSERLAQSAK